MDDAAVEVSDGVYALGLPEVPVYLLRCGSAFALVEGGCAALSGLVLRQLQDRVGDLRAVTHWLITHSHYDHCGLLPYLVPRLPNVRILASRETSRAFGSARARAVVDRLSSDASATWWSSYGPDPALVAERRALGELAVETVEPGATVELPGGRRLRALAAPGHARCQLAFFEPRRSTCFVSDALGEYVAPGRFCPLVFDDARAYRDTIRRLAMCDAETTLLAHHAVLHGADSRRACADAIASLHECWQRARRAAARAIELETAARALTAEFGARSRDFVPDALHVSSMERMLSLLSKCDPEEL